MHLYKEPQRVNSAKESQRGNYTGSFFSSLLAYVMEFTKGKKISPLEWNGSYPGWRG